MSTNLLEKVTSQLEREFYILPPSVRSRGNQTFGDWLQTELNRLGLSPYAAENKSKEEAARRGVDEKTFTISDATINNILGGSPPNLQMGKLFAIAWITKQPIEVVVAKAFGFEVRLTDLQRSDVMALWDLHQQLSDESTAYFTKRIADLRREMEMAPGSTKKSKR